jgi:hypothetical protein
VEADRPNSGNNEHTKIQQKTKGYLPPIHRKVPDRGPPIGDLGSGAGPPGKAMTNGHGVEDPGPGAFEGRPAPGPDTGETAPGLKERETPETGDRRTLPIDGGRGSKIVFVDFGRNKVYALEDDGNEVMVFDDFAEMVEKLKPSVVVADANL